VPHAEKEIRAFSAFCLRLRAGYVQIVEKIGLSSLDDPEKSSSAFACQQSLPLLRVVDILFSFRSRCLCGERSLWMQIALVRPDVEKCTGGEVRATPSLHCWFVCCNQLNSRFLPNLRPGLQSCNTTNLTALTPHERFLLDFGVVKQAPLCSVP
jgi:hypothetical protein